MGNNSDHFDSDERPNFENIRYSRGTASARSQYNTLNAERGSGATHEPTHSSDKYSEIDLHAPVEGINAFRCIGAWITDDTDMTAKNGRIAPVDCMELDALTHGIVLERNQSGDPWVAKDLIMPEILTASSAPRMRTRRLLAAEHPQTTITGLSPSELAKSGRGVENSRAHTRGHQLFTKRMSTTLSAAAILAAAIVLIAFNNYGAGISSIHF